VASGSQGANFKQLALQLVRRQLDPQKQAGLLEGEAYREVARAASHRLRQLVAKGRATWEQLQAGREGQLVAEAVHWAERTRAAGGGEGSQGVAGLQG
jgi:hypothetical protein